MPDQAPTHRSGRGTHLAWVAAAGLVLMVVGLSAWWLQGPRLDALSRQPGTATDTAGRSPAPPEAARAPREPGAPRRLVIPTLGVDAPVVPVRAPGGTLVPPSDPTRLGWWADGARPGETTGSALVAGHTVHTGGGAFDDLEQVRRGDEVVVRTSRDAVAYTVDRVRTYGKGVLAERADRLFSQEVGGRLVLITCEDWNGTEYLSNVVVTASPVPVTG